MKSNQTRGLQAFRRIEAWFADHPQVIENSGSSKEALAGQVNALKEVVTRMTARGTEQTTQAKQATLAAKDEDRLRDDLRTIHMKAIVEMAQGLRGKVPGVAVLAMPGARMKSENLLHAAEAMSTTAAIYKEVFAEHGLPQDFLEQLDASAAALKASIDARGVARSKSTGARDGIDEDLKLGRRIVRMINSSLTHVLKSDSATRTSWRQAKRATVKGAQSRSRVGGDPMLDAVALGGVRDVSGSVSPTPNTDVAARIATTASVAGTTATPAVNGSEPSTSIGVVGGLPTEVRAA